MDGHAASLLGATIIATLLVAPVGQQICAPRINPNGDD
jgi:hypothetical protein